MIKYKCFNCGVALDKSQTVVSDEHIFCPRCALTFNTCHMCKALEACPFETDRTCNLPKVVPKVVQRNNVRMEMEIPNPERIQKICVEGGCPCYDEELQICMKSTDALTCRNYNEKIF